MCDATRHPFLHPPEQESENVPGLPMVLARQALVQIGSICNRDRCLPFYATNSLPIIRAKREGIFLDEAQASQTKVVELKKKCIENRLINPS